MSGAGSFVIVIAVAIALIVGAGMAVASSYRGAEESFRNLIKACEETGGLLARGWRSDVVDETWICVEPTDFRQ